MANIVNSSFYFFVIAILTLVNAQEDVSSTSACYGSGSIALAVILTFFFTVLLVAALYYVWHRRQKNKKGSHLILESDPEKGKGEYAFDNPGFKDASIITASEKSLKPDSANKTKWGHWSPLSALQLKPEKRRALDDSALENHEVKVVALKSQDFTGLGFNICGNMREGIFIKDILHRGPAFESGKLSAGDRINSVTISFEHMVYEDALTILSYASPYEVMIEAKSGRVISFTQGQGGNPSHPVYRSSSCTDLFHIEKTSKKKLFGDDHSSSSNYSSLQKSKSNVTTLERKESKSPRPNQPKLKKSEKSPNKMTPEMLKTHLEQRLNEEDLRVRDKVHKIDVELQKSENKHQKFGIRVLPTVNQEKSPKIIEQNQNNLNIEKNMEEIPIRSIDEVDVIKPQPPQPRKREKKSPEPGFERNGSGIKRDKDGIPQEIPDYMFDAAVVARRNRKSSMENIVNGESDDDLKEGRRSKGKAPAPPKDIALNLGFGEGKTKAFEDLRCFRGTDSSPSDDTNVKYGSDSEEETENTMSSVNTIELNSSDITIHQTEEEERKARKTVSTGDLSKIKKIPRSNAGTLERAQSLDITDTSGPSLVKKRTYDATENLLIDREPRLSLILDGLTTFQRNTLKKSTEWGNLEDAILNLSRDDSEWAERRRSEPQFNAVMDRVIQIKRESEEIQVIPNEVVQKYRNGEEEKSTQEPKVLNTIWPGEEEMEGVKFENSGWRRFDGPKEVSNINIKDDRYVRRQQVPVVPERTFNSARAKLNEEKERRFGDVTNLSFEEKHEKENGEKIPQPLERVSKTDTNSYGIPETKITSTTVQNGMVELSPSPNQPSSPKTHTPLNLTNPNISIEFECVKPTPEKRQPKPGDKDCSTVVDLIKVDVPMSVTSFQKQTISKTCEQIANERHSQREMIKDEWEIEDTLINTSPPSSLTFVDEVMDSFNKNYNTTVTVVKPDDVTPSSPGPSSMSSNIPDETKSIGSLRNATESFIFTEKSSYESDTNIPDDVKVSRHSYESLEAKNLEPKSDDAKTEDLILSHVTVTENGGSNLHSLELSINEPSELYTTALESSLNDATKDVTVFVSRPNTVNFVELGMPVVEITENSFSKMATAVEQTPIEISERKNDDYQVEIMESKYSKFRVDDPTVDIVKTSFGFQPSPVEESHKVEVAESRLPMVETRNPLVKNQDLPPRVEQNISAVSDSNNADTKTYITEIQVVTPNSSTDSMTNNVSEIEVTPNEVNLESAFENYVKNFESKLDAFESNIQNFDNNLEEFIRDEPKSIILEEKSDVEKQVSKIQEIAEEQLKTLPEMRFSTSSYDTGRKTPEKRHSFELLRSNFEKSNFSDRSPPRRESTTPPKSRIPIATTGKTPPTSPERRDSRNLENENEKAILELISSSSIHSTPFTSKIKPPSISSKNVSVTSIRTNSKVPSGLPTLAGRPPIPPRKTETDNGVQVSTNGGVESSFKQWVFNPNSNVTNVTVGKEK